MERRAARDNELYTYSEFMERYGHGAYANQMWENARATRSLTTSWPPATPKPAATNSGVEPPAATNRGVEPPVVFTYEELTAMRQIPGFGCKHECQKQRELRAQLLPEGIFELDLTHGPWNWRQGLKA